jgi:hypothetical protein
MYIEAVSGKTVLHLRYMHVLRIASNWLSHHRNGKHNHYASERRRRNTPSSHHWQPYNSGTTAHT